MAKKTTKKTTVKKTPQKKSPAKKATTKKSVVKKTVDKKAANKKSATKKVARKATKKTATKSSIPTTSSPESTSTTVVAKFDAGYGNNLYIRGSGAGLAWDQGLMMKNQGRDEWTWTSDAVAEELEFKILINDRYWSAGANGVVFPGARVIFEPNF